MISFETNPSEKSEDSNLSYPEKVPTIANTSSTKKFEKILPETLFEERGVYCIMDKVLSNPRFAYYPESDNMNETYYGSGRLTREPFITEIAKTLELDTQNYRWLAEGIFDYAKEGGMLDKLGRNRKKEPYYTINYTYNVPGGLEEDIQEAIELNDFIEKVKNYALIGVSTIIPEEEEVSEHKKWKQGYIPEDPDGYFRYREWLETNSETN